MRILLQRVSHAQVAIAGAVHSEIGQGFLLLLGIEEADGQDDIDFLCKKVAQIRLFNDAEGVMNLSLQEVEGSLMVVSQFTLYASTKKGNRPSYIRAADLKKQSPYMELLSKGYKNSPKSLLPQVYLEPICKWVSAMMDLLLSL